VHKSVIKIYARINAAAGYDSTVRRNQHF